MRILPVVWRVSGNEQNAPAGRVNESSTLKTLICGVAAPAERVAHRLDPRIDRRRCGPHMEHPEGVGAPARGHEERTAGRVVGVPAGRVEVHDLSDPLPRGPAEVVLVECLIGELGDVGLGPLEGPPHASSINLASGGHKGRGPKDPRSVGWAPHGFAPTVGDQPSASKEASPT